MRVRPVMPYALLLHKKNNEYLISQFIHKRRDSHVLPIPAGHKGKVLSWPFRLLKHHIQNETDPYIVRIDFISCGLRER